MNSKEDGSLEFSTVVLVLFLAAVVAGGLLYMDVIRKYMTVSFHKAEVLGLSRDKGLEIFADFSVLVECDHDSKFNEELLSIQSRYKGSGITIEDLSSKINVPFLSYEEFESKAVRDALFLNNSSEVLVSDITNGLLPGHMSDLRKYIKQEALEYCTVYGWMSVFHINSPAFAHISRVHATENLKELHPVINSLPMINVNYVDRAVLSLYVKNTKYGIRKAEEKITAITTLAEVRGVDRSMLAAILDVPKTNSIYSIFGVKTMFWKITYTFNEIRYYMILCAVPSMDNGSEVERYELSEWGKYIENEWY